MESVPFRFFNERDTLSISRNRLPHWEQAGVAYFLTFSLADSIPQALLRSWKERKHTWLLQHPEPWDEETSAEYHEIFTAKVEAWLDQGHGICVLRSPECWSIARNALLHHDANRYKMLSFAVMPNHIHLLCVPFEGYTLKKLLHTWRSYASNEINKHLGQSGQLWQRDYYNRIIRDGSHLYRCLKYIRNNPSKANLPNKQFTLYESEFAQEFLELPQPSI